MNSVDRLRHVTYVQGERLSIGGGTKVMRLVAVRKALGWSQSRLAREAQMHPSTISAIESGRLSPWPGQAARIQEALGYEGGADVLFEELDGGR